MRTLVPAVSESPARSGPLFLGAVVALGVVLMVLAAKTQIPFYPVPMTLHTLAVFTFALAFGPRLAGAVFVSYLALGAMGLPVFSGTPERGIGLAYMAGPTGGYLAGYLAATLAAGTLGAGRGLSGRCLAAAAGLAALYLLGNAWLCLFVPLDRVLALGAAPFLPGDLLKVGVAILAAPALGRGLRRIRGEA
jgi:biotin transport system substrate-specific component